MIELVIEDPALVRRSATGLTPDPSRVITRLFLPGQETLARGISRADAVIQRVLRLPEADVGPALDAVLSRFGERHHDLRAVFAEHFAQIEHRLPAGTQLTPEHRDLIGAYFTQEYSVEAAALFNPSMVAHPDQSGLAAGALRFVMSVRGVGEGHISSIEFRTGVIDADGEVVVDVPGPQLDRGRPAPGTTSRALLREVLLEGAVAADVDHVLGLLPARFDAADLDTALASVRRDRLTRGNGEAVLQRIRWLASCNYLLDFDPGRPLGGRVIHPVGPDESHGVEDARFTRFTRDDGSVTYYGTYTAFDGSNISSHLLHTDDFRDFELTRLVGAAARDKGMAMFPRQVSGRYLMLSRWDRETIGVAASTEVGNWPSAVTVQEPSRPWQAIQLGNCGPPLETDAGWLVLTHGVGPMRTYGIGAILLDLDDPTVLLGSLDEPFLTPDADERDGYVPNVVYSCGGLVHGDRLVLPYGCSDSKIRFAVVDLTELLSRLTKP